MIKMNINKQIEINRSIEDVWHVLAEKFADISLWYAPVEKSYPLEIPKMVKSAPLAGRVCEFKRGKVLETITTYDSKNYHLVMDVTPSDVPKIFPVKSNVAHFKLQQLTNGRTRVDFSTDLKIQWFAYPLYLALKLGLNKSFSDLLKGLKRHCEINDGFSQKAMVS